MAKTTDGRYIGSRVSRAATGAALNSCRVDHLEVITEILVIPERSMDAMALATWP
jgi:hypothetical protein